MKIQEFQNLYERMDEDKIEENFYKDFPTNYGEWECYKSDIAFADASLDEVMYVPEDSYVSLPLEPTVFSKQDLIDECDGCVELAEYVYDSLSWQYPSTYIEELLSEYLDVVIDYNKEAIHDSSIHEALWNMLNDSEKEKVLAGCK